MAIRKTGITALLFLLGSLASAGAQALKLPGDWKSVTAKQSYAALVEALEKSVGENKMGVVNKASASAGIKARFNEDISGNAVIGVFRPDFAKRMLAASIAAGIEAPVRFYVTENADKTATLSWRPPSAVFAPYTEGGDALKAMAAELDTIFEKIAADAVK